MFAKILQWIKGVWQKMIGQSSIKSKLNVNVALNTDMAKAIDLWSKMYRNNSPWLKKDEVFGLNLPAAIASEIARSVTIEMKVSCGEGPRAAFLQKQVDRVVPKLRQMIEYGCAKGGLVLKPYPKKQGIEIDFVQADQVFPTEFDADGNITGCIFADQKVIGNDYFTKLEYHHFGAIQIDKDNSLSGYVIENMAFKSSTADELGTTVPLNSVRDWAEIQPQAVINIDRPLFAYFRYPMANNIDSSSPLGVSCFSRAVPLIEQADRAWSDLLWEIKSSKRALYVDELAFDRDEKGMPILPDIRLYRTLKIGGGVEDSFFKEWSPTIREENYLKAIDAILKKIEYQCGLASGTLSDPNVEEKTATEIKISKQRTFSTITDTQKSLKDALEQLIWGMDTWVTLANLAPEGQYQTNYSFDDSIVTDADTQFTKDTQAVGLGVMGKVEFRMRNYGEDEQTAKKMVAMAEAETNPKDFFPNE